MLKTVKLIPLLVLQIVFVCEVRSQNVYDHPARRANEHDCKLPSNSDVPGCLPMQVPPRPSSNAPAPTISSTQSNKLINGATQPGLEAALKAWADSASRLHTDAPVSVIENSTIDRNWFKDQSITKPSTERTSAKRVNEQCENASRIRDQELVSEWDVAMTRYELNRDHLLTITKLKQDMLDDAWWRDNPLPEVAIGVNQLVNTVERALQATRGDVGVAMSLGRRTTVEFLRNRKYRNLVLGSLAAGKDLVTAYKEGIMAAVVDQVFESALGDLGPVGAAIGYAKDTHETIETLRASVDAKLELQKQLQNLDSELQRYDAKLHDESVKTAAISQIVEGIDMYCAGVNSSRVTTPTATPDPRLQIPRP